MSNKNPDDMSFLDHIEVLRWHLIRSISVVMILAVVAFIFRDIIFDDIILAPREADFITNRLLCELSHSVGTEALCINQTKFDLISISLPAQLMVHLTVSMLAGFIIAFPYVFWEFWRFLKPALSKREIKHSRGAVFFASTLFTLGAAFGYYIITPLSLNFLGSYSVSSEVANQITISSYIRSVSSAIFAPGVVFELPVFIYFLSKIGLVTSSFLKKYRKHAFIVILTLSAIITPPDIFSQILVSVPLVILYEAGIFMAKHVEKKEAKAMANGEL